MHCDIVIADGNEADFIEMAIRLGYGALAIVSDKQITENRIKILRAAFPKGRTRPGCDILISQDGEREILEKTNPDLIYGLEQAQKKDHLHQRRSGLNHINAAICAKKGISVGFSFASLLDEKTRARTIGRMKQNIMLCRKYNVHMTIGSFANNPYEMRAPQDLISLFTAIGMQPGEARKGLMLNETN